MIKLRSLLISLLIALGGGWVISLLTKDQMEVYNNIILPKFAPPMAVFSVVWTILYLLVGISAYFVF